MMSVTWVYFCIAVLGLAFLLVVAYLLRRSEQQQSIPDEVSRDIQEDDFMYHREMRSSDSQDEQQ